MVSSAIVLLFFFVHLFYFILAVREHQLKTFVMLGGFVDFDR